MLIFTMIQLPPGDYFESYMVELQSQGETVNPAQMQFLREQYGFDKPIWEQYLHWAGGMLHGDLGYSFEYELPVTSLSATRVCIMTMLVVVRHDHVYLDHRFPDRHLFGDPPYSWGDYGLTFLGLLGLAMPNFLLALVMMYFAKDWFNTSIGGLYGPAIHRPADELGQIRLDPAGALWIPVIVIGTSGTAGMIRRVRANLLDELRKPYVTTARAKGMPPNSGR